MIPPIIRHPEAILHVPTRPVPPASPVSDETASVVATLKQTLAATTGVGLAAPQIGSSSRICIVWADRYDEHGKERPGTSARVLINPVVTRISGTQQSVGEECKSLPDIRVTIPRSECIEISATDENGQPFTWETHGFAAIVVQHEIDHLDGTLVIDYLSHSEKKYYEDVFDILTRIEKGIIPDTPASIFLSRLTRHAEETYTFSLEEGTLTNTDRRLVHLLQKQKGFRVGVDKSTIDRITVYEIIRPSEIPTALFRLVTPEYKKLGDECFIGAGYSAIDIVESLFRDESSMVSYILTETKTKNIIGSMGNVLLTTQYNDTAVRVLNMYSVMLTPAYRGKHITKRIMSSLIRRFDPMYIWASTMNPRFISAYYESLKMYDYKMELPYPDQPLSADHQRFIMHLHATGQLASPLPNTFGVRTRHIHGLQSPDVLKTMWENTEQFVSCRFALALQNAGLFNPFSGDQLFLSAWK